ncbi:glycine dehydrogenase, partial [Candidatus Bipolaricaulota bacterium]|nr:glycine dehydrogenase [Candidatus Bipolaricaulota bacterium]
VYLAALGPEGLRRVALLSIERAHDLAARIQELPGYELAFSRPFFNEFAVRCAAPEEAVARLREAGIAVLPPGLVAKAGLDGAFLVAVTEKRTEEELSRFVEALKGEGYGDDL